QSTDTLTVHFASNESVLQPEDRVVIDRQFNLYKPRLKSIDLVGYCDNVGGLLYNDSLSLQRVVVVKKYLQSKGLADSLFKVVRSYGKRRPLNDNADEEERSLNRRVAIVWRLADLVDSSNLAKALQDTAAFAGKNIVLNVLFIRDTHHPLNGSFSALHELL